MQCTSPLYAIKKKCINKKGVESFNITILKNEKKMDYDQIRDRYKDNLFDAELMILPCGQCISCRLNKSRDWANRICLESNYYTPDICHFVTLTYDDEHLPYIVDLDGELTPSLDKCHLTKFMKDLRRYYEYHFNITGIRFFACGEYGDLNCRPHFHVILFGLPINDLYLFRTHNGNPYYISDTISKIWKNGFVTICNLSWDSAAYVSRYVLKKVNGFFKDAHYRGIEPEFINMSRNPGIGRQYYDDNLVDIYANDEIYICGSKQKATKIKPPKYYDNLFDLFYPEHMEVIKNVRKKHAEESYNNRKSKTDLSDYEYNLNSARKADKIKSKLIRSL